MILGGNQDCEEPVRHPGRGVLWRLDVSWEVTGEVKVVMEILKLLAHSYVDVQWEELGAGMELEKLIFKGRRRRHKGACAETEMARARVQAMESKWENQCGIPLNSLASKIWGKKE